MSESASALGSSGSEDATPDIPQDAPAGHVTMVSPDPFEPVPLYKVYEPDPITFEWSYSGLIATPSAITLDAFCPQNGQTYAVSPPDGISPAETTYVWNPAEQEHGRDEEIFPQATYSLRIYGTDGPLAAPEPGRLSPLLNARFAMYSPGAYTGLADGWECAACKGSASSLFSSSSPFPFVLSFLTVSISVGVLRLRSFL